MKYKFYLFFVKLCLQYREKQFTGVTSLREYRCYIHSDIPCVCIRKNSRCNLLLRRLLYKALFTWCHTVNDFTVCYARVYLWYKYIYVATPILLLYVSTVIRNNSSISN